MRKIKKKFDAVGMMRSIRAELSVQIEGMTLEEERDWLALQELKDPLNKPLRYRCYKCDSVTQTNSLRYA